MRCSSLQTLNSSNQNTALAVFINCVERKKELFSEIRGSISSDTAVQRITPLHFDGPDFLILPQTHTFICLALRSRGREAFTMWDRNQMLLATICFTALVYRVAAGNEELLESPSDVVDDLYSGCRQQAMERFIQSDVLKQELNNSVGFYRVWTRCSECRSLIPGGKQAHMTALAAYVLADEDFQKVFDNAVKTLGANISTYENYFHFKSLHFLLMDAMTLLKPETCQTLFALWENPVKPKKGSVVRFGSFTGVTSNFQALKKLNDFDGLVFLNITSCFFANVGENSCVMDKDKVLLSPAEEFIVEEVKKIDEDDTEYTKVVLKSSRLNSTHNCFAFSRSPAAVSTLWLVPVLVISSFLYLPV